jgi:hypothetical protein
MLWSMEHMEFKLWSVSMECKYKEFVGFGQKCVG